MQLPDRWTKEDIQFLLDKLDDYCILVSDTRLAIPTIHEIRNAQHCGFGVFVAETNEYKVSFCGGGALNRTPSGQGWCTLGVERGAYPYDKDTVRNTLLKYLEEQDEN